jgi:tetratricopeptide (TPR) repeat protein
MLQFPAVSRQGLHQNYTREQVLRVAGVSERQVRIWERGSLMPQRESYSMADLHQLQTLLRMKQAGLGPKRIRAVLEAIRRKLPVGENVLSEVTVAIENRAVRVLVEGQHMEPSSGQLRLNFDPLEINRLLSFPIERRKERDEQRDKKRQSEAQEWFERGLELEQSGLQHDQAMAAYERALELDPECVGALVNVGTLHFQARHWRKAEEFYKKALELEPDYALAHYNLANLCDERGDIANAFNHYGQALEIAPNYADSHYNLALLCQRTGQFMKAVRHWRTYLKLDPSSSWADVARRELAKLREEALVR